MRDRAAEATYCDAVRPLAGRGGFESRNGPRPSAVGLGKMCQHQALGNVCENINRGGIRISSSVQVPLKSF